MAARRIILQYIIHKKNKNFYNISLVDLFWI